jgi:hypothetical protein
MGTYLFGGSGHIRADDGGIVAMFYWSLLTGFHTLRIGRMPSDRHNTRRAR